MVAAERPRRVLMEADGLRCDQHAAVKAGSPYFLIFWKCSVFMVPRQACRTFIWH